MLLPIGFRIPVPGKPDPSVPGRALGGMRWQPTREVVLVRLTLSSLHASFVSVLAGVATRQAHPLVLGCGPVNGEHFLVQHARPLDPGKVGPGLSLELWLENEDTLSHDVLGVLELEVPGYVRGDRPPVASSHLAAAEFPAPEPERVGES